MLDDIWGANDEVVRHALEQADWNFATRTVEGDYTPSIEPDFGFRKAFSKPTDLARLTSLATDEYFRHVLRADQYADESDYWFTEYELIYVKYVSKDSDYGFDSGKWTQGFRKYLEAYIAWEACERLTNSDRKRVRQERDMLRLLKAEKSRDAQAEGVKMFPHGSWVRSRGLGSNRERSKLQ